MSLEPVRVDDLEVLEERFQNAFVTGRAEGLDVVGYGEITSVVSWPGVDGMVVAKRLPTFRHGEGVEAYLALVEDYVTGLRAVDVSVVPTSHQTLRLEGRDVAVYLLQPLLAPERVGHVYLREASEQQAIRLFDRVFEKTEAAIGAQIGIDAQISNWAVDGDDLVYFDITTPLLRDDRGVDRIDVDIFLASLPWAIRGIVKRFLVVGIIEDYFDVRTTILNLVAQFHKERLIPLIPLALEQANRRLSDPIGADEVKRYYTSDARMWELLQRLRRMDRWWHHKVRRCPYPFLLPGKIDR